MTDIRTAANERAELIATIRAHYAFPCYPHDPQILAAADMLEADAALADDLIIAYMAGVEAGRKQAQQVAVPDGWALVPIEPTDAMCEAAWEGEGVDYVGEHMRIHRADLAYKSMIAAAQGEKP